MRFEVKVVGDKELGIYLNNITKNIKKEAGSGLVEIGTYLRQKVRDRLGNYHYTWPKLKRATVVAKMRRRAGSGISVSKRKGKNLGLGNDEPLVLFSKLKKSISKETSRATLTTTVYSDSEHAAVHEYGYRQVPARSYMRTTLFDEEDAIFKIIDRHIEKLI